MTTSSATPAAPRFDMYGAIHKALRRFMCDTLLKLGALDVDDLPEAARTLEQTSALLTMMRGHLQHENDFVHTAIEARRPSGARDTANDHLEHLASIRALESEVAALAASGVPGERRAMAQRLYRHLSLFVAENLHHMHVEETVNNTLLWSLYSDAELVEIHDRLLASIPPQEMMLAVHWMAPSLNPLELSAVVGDARRKTPAEPFGHLLQVVRGRVDDGSWRKLSRALGMATTAA